MNRGYRLLWRKIGANPLLHDAGKKFSRLDEEFVVPEIADASKRKPCRLFWDNIDKPKITDFKTWGPVILGGQPLPPEARPAGRPFVRAGKAQTQITVPEQPGSRTTPPSCWPASISKGCR
jgi:hypothetical protein